MYSKIIFTIKYCFYLLFTHKGSSIKDGKKIPQSRIIKGSSLKDDRRFLNQGSKKACSMKDQEIFPNQGSKKVLQSMNLCTFMNVFLKQKRDRLFPP